MIFKSLAVAAAFIVGMPTIALTQEQGIFVSGLRPFERPANAPRVSDQNKDQDWYVEALHGVIQPYPYNLRFLEDQGEWFSPFLRAGMTGRYDLRGWHNKTR